MRARVIIFLAVLLVVTILQTAKVIGGPVPLLIGMAVYVIAVLPAIGKR